MLPLESRDTVLKSEEVLASEELSISVAVINSLSGFSVDDVGTGTLTGTTAVVDLSRSQCALSSSILARGLILRISSGEIRTLMFL